ncbi:hypothetical protein Tco_0905410 [Tanacetum coccineum]
MSTQQDINAFRTQRLANTHDPLALMANTQTPFHPDQSSHITYIQHPQPNNHFIQQPSFNTNYMQQPMQNLKDSSDPTTIMNMTLALIAKAFKVNTIPTNNNQRSSLIPRNSQIAQSGMNTSQDIKMQMVDDNVGNQVRHNAVQNDGNEVGKNVVQNPSIQIVENMKGLSVVLEIANQYGNGNVETAPAEGNGNGKNGNLIRCYNYRGEGHYASNCTMLMKKQRVKVNCTSEDTLQQASTSGTLSENAPVYDSDRSTKVPKDENCYDHDIFNMLTHEVQYTDLQTELDPYNDMQQKIEQLQAQLGDLKGKSSDTQCASNTLDPMSQKLEDENVSLEFQVSEPKGTTKGMRTNTMFTKQSILGKPPSSSYKPKLYSVTPFPKSLVLPKVDKKNALSKQVTSNSAPSTRESKVVQTVNVIAPRIFRTNPSKTSSVDNIVPKKPVKTSVRIKPITVSQLNVIHKQQVNSDSNGFSSTRVNNIAKTRRPHPRSNSNTDRVPSNANVSIHENQKKHKANAKKSKELGSKGSLASSRPNKPRTCLRWIPTGRIFSMCGKLTASSNTKNKSEKSVCDNASTSNPSKPSSKGFSNSASLLGSQNRRDLPRNTPLDRVEVLGMIEKRSKVRMGIMPTETELALEQSQQGVSYEVSVSIEGVEE